MATATTTGKTMGGMLTASAAASGAAKAPAKAKKPAAKKASAVRKALQAIDPDVLTDARSGVEQLPAKARRRRFSATPIVRPNGEAYRPRLLSEGRSDVEIMRICRENDTRVILYGFPGCGKTALVEAAFGDELMQVEGHSDTEVADFIGTWVPEAGGSYRWVDGPLLIAMREGRPLFVDDATLIAPGVIARLYPAMDGRRSISVREHEGETIKAEKGFFVIAAHNPGVPGAILSEALASRFAMHVRVESDLKMAERMGVAHKAVKIAAHLRHIRDKAEGFGWAPEMRELLDFKRISETLGEVTALANMISAAPDEARQEVINAIKPWYAEIEGLALRGEDPGSAK